MMKTSSSVSRERRGQALVETALILPLFTMVVFGTIVLGLGVFYQQQVTNAAREAARYAAVHSASAGDAALGSQANPVGGWLPPLHPQPVDAGPWNADAPPNWPRMTAHAQGFVHGFPKDQLHVAACWSGYQEPSGLYDAGPINASTGAPNTWVDCTIAGIDPINDTGSLPCPSTTTATDDASSNLAISPGLTGAEATNRVVAYACYAWSPPLAGFLLIPETITLRAVISEGLQHQR